jgi:hypothetical protein
MSVKTKLRWLALLLIFAALTLSTVNDQSQVGAASKANTCCVTCDGITVCAASVDMYCGTCDAGSGGRPTI